MNNKEHCAVVATEVGFGGRVTKVASLLSGGPKVLGATVLVGIGLWIGYNLGHRNGIQEERQAWLSTEQVITNSPSAPSRDGDERLQRPHRATRTIYSDPRSSKMVLAGAGKPWVNTAEPRTLQRSGQSLP